MKPNDDVRYEDINTDDDKALSISTYSSILQQGQKKNLDFWYGVRKINNKLMIGRFDIKFYNDSIKVKDKSYPKTEGLLELSFKKDPNIQHFTNSDLKAYKDILESTDGYRMSWKKENQMRTLKGNVNYENIIVPLFNVNTSRRKKPKINGAGIIPRYKVAKPNSTIDYVYWDEPNELVDRLRLILSEQAAGNFSHTYEFVTIIQELREGGYIY